MRNIIYIVLIFIIGLSSCKKDKLNSKDLERVQSCHNENNLDSLTLVQSLVGSKWEWKYVECFWTPDEGNNDDFKGLKIEFLTNQIKVNHNNQETIYQWELVSNRSLLDKYELETTPSFSLAYGAIVLCDNSLVFYDSYIDGCDNYYKRVEQYK